MHACMPYWFRAVKPAWCPPPPVSLLVEGCPYGGLERIKSEERNGLSITQNICLPARALRTINKIRQHTKATGPLLSPHVSCSFHPSLPSHFVFGSFASTMQTFSGLSSPLILRELIHKPSSCAHGNTNMPAEAQLHTLRINIKINAFMLKGNLAIPHTYTHTLLLPPASLLLCRVYGVLE